ncbi:MAG: glycosyltransferase family 4 protein [Nannocystaceae bacterium]
MRVALIITRSDAVGGAQIHVRDLAQALKEDGHDPVVLAGERGPLFGMLDDVGVEHRALSMVRELSPLRDLGAIIELRRQLSVLRPDVVALHSSKAGILGRLAARKLGLPVVFTAHGWAFATSKNGVREKTYLWLERLCARHCDGIITVSEHARRLALENGVGTPDLVRTIHNGVPDVLPRLQSEPGVFPPRIVVVARLQPPKDYGTLFAALTNLRALPWSLRWIGDGPRRVHAERLAARLGLHGRVTFSGSSVTVDDELSRAQVFVLTSLHEGFPLSILEAMRAGLPVVATDVGGIPESVDHGRTGLLVAPQDETSLTEALGRLLQDAALRKDMGAAGRTRYERKFDVARQYAATLRFYREVAAR